MRRLVLKYERSEVKVVSSLLPAYSRYFNFLGVVERWHGEWVDVCVFGQSAGGLGYALARRPHA